MTKERIPYADGLDADDQRCFLDSALATEFKLPSPYGLGLNQHYELAAFRFWETVEPDVMDHWLDAHAGSRPSGFWWWRAPEPLRMRIGGSGEAAWRDYTGKAEPVTGRRVCKQFSRGGLLMRMPEMKAVTADQPDYRGTWHGLPITGWDAYEGIRRERVSTIDAANPPTFESEASYLRRHKLLTAAEAKMLGDDDFEPVVLVLRHCWNGTLEWAGSEAAKSASTEGIAASFEKAFKLRIG
jgi:hypothetical protein